MNYHNITTNDMNNGDGLRVVLWVAGCAHHCKGCQNPITWDAKDGLEFTEDTLNEILEELSKPYVSGLTFSGGDPLHEANRETVKKIARAVKMKYPDKTLWLYTGYTWEDIEEDMSLYRAIQLIDVLVDGRYEESLRDVSYPWAGSTNQRVIDVQISLATGRIILHESH